MKEKVNLVGLAYFNGITTVVLILSVLVFVKSIIEGDLFGAMLMALVAIFVGFYTYRSTRYVFQEWKRIK